MGQASSKVDTELRLKEGAIVLGSINHPAVAYQLETELSRLNFKFNDLKNIRDAILAELPLKEDVNIDSFHEKIKKRLRFDAVATLKKIPHLSIHPFLDIKASKFNAHRAIQDAITRHNSILDFNSEIEQAKNQFLASDSEDITIRIQRANKSLQKAIKGSEHQILNNDELTKASTEKLSSMIKEKIWLKKK